MIHSTRVLRTGDCVLVYRGGSPTFGFSPASLIGNALASCVLTSTRTSSLSSLEAYEAVGRGTSTSSVLCLQAYEAVGRGTSTSP